MIDIGSNSTRHLLPPVHSVSTIHASSPSHKFFLTLYTQAFSASWCVQCKGQEVYQVLRSITNYIYSDVFGRHVSLKEIAHFRSEPSPMPSISSSTLPLIPEYLIATTKPSVKPKSATLSIYHILIVRELVRTFERYQEDVDSTKRTILGTEEAVADPRALVVKMLVEACEKLDMLRSVYIFNFISLTKTLKNFDACFNSNAYSALFKGLGLIIENPTTQSATDISQGQTARSTCIDCAAGSFTNATNSTICIPCSRGMYQDQEGEQDCKDCAVGRFSIDAGQTVCQICGFGKFSNTTASFSCLECPPGSYQPQAEQASSIPCPVGSYQDSPSQSGCKVCAPGHCSNKTGAVVCDPCLAGSNQSSFLSTECLPCKVGEFTSTTAQAGCSACDVGTYQNYTGSSKCEDCFAGTFQPSFNSTGCLLCDPGQPFTCKISRLRCPAGRSAATNGSVLCTACRSGTYQGRLGRSDCDICTSGRYTPDPPIGVDLYGAEGSEECVYCAAGTYQLLIIAEAVLLALKVLINYHVVNPCVINVTMVVSVQSRLLLLVHHV